MAEILFADAHLHSSPNGLGAREIARRFLQRGGWFMALVMLPPWHYDLSLSKNSVIDTYKEAIRIFLRECEEARSSGIRVSCLAGFHPAEVDKLIGLGLRPEEVLSVGEKIVEYEARLCKEGVIDGIGEVGRQHYKTMPERLAIALTVTVKALEYARDLGCLVHLHLENAGPVTVDTVDKLVEIIHAPRGHIVFHHSSIRVAERATGLGYYATLPGKKEVLVRAFTKGLSIDRVMVESDYIDDPKRPCVSSCPWEIVDNQLELLRKGVVDEETLAKINIDNPSRYYGVEPP